MEIALLVILFLIGSIGAAFQALEYIERRTRPRGRADPGPTAGQRRDAD